MKKYYKFVKPNDEHFRNVYLIFWCESQEDEQFRLENYPTSERITRKEAEFLVRSEKFQRKYNIDFSGYAPTVIECVQKYST